MEQLDQFDAFIAEKKRSFIGYPVNCRFHLAELLDWWSHSEAGKNMLNNVGDPYQPASYLLNAFSFERDVVDFFSSLFQIKEPWGYVTASGTQGNEQGLYMGRCLLEMEYGKPILYVSNEAHYSVKSLGRLLGLQCIGINCFADGQMDYSDFEKKLNSSCPALVAVSIGTTFKGAIDDVHALSAIIKKKGVPGAYYHADAALFGGYLPFLHDSDPTAPDLSFASSPYDSISVSGHKFFGAPVPLGIFMAKNCHVQKIKSEFIDYIGTYNVTIPCSRSSLNVMIFWWLISTVPFEQFCHEAREITDNAKYLHKELLKREYPAWLNPYSNTVYLKQPVNRVSDKWVLSRMMCPQMGSIAHVVVMQHVDKEIIDQFLRDIEGIAPDEQMGLAF